MRKATVADVPAIMDALKALLKISPAPHMRMAQPMPAELGVRHAIHEERAVIIGDFFLMYSICQPWYSDEAVFFEDIVLKISKHHGNKVDEVIAAIETLSALYGCNYAATGDTQIGYMGPKYEARGFEYMGQQYLKGPFHGSTQSAEAAA